MTLRTSGLIISLASLALGVAACSNETATAPNAGTAIPPEPGVFESDAPGQSGSHNGKAGGAVASEDASYNSAVASTAAPQAADSGSSGEAARAIEEADIIKIEGSRLYALSQYGGLSVIDIATRDQMRLLGRQRVDAQPFEMYVRDQIVFALYNGYGEYVKGTKDGEWSWVTTGYVMAFDTSNAAQPTTIGRFSIPGTVQDSRIVGNVLYVVGFESNGCWSCATGQHTTVLSLDVSNPSAIRKVDERAYADDTSSAYSWKRSISVTDRRMYIAGPEYGTNSPVGSSIQVVDISNPSGILVDGATVSAAGKIDSRWQMDETDSVLRVISQPGDWRPADPPRIQTFQVNSAQSLAPLASVAMTVPNQENLRSVRFDGPRAYAITAIQTDPLFTIDLSNAAQPKQVGELQMPGWIYYMEPRGERVVALGYDQNNTAGALTVSLFDVSNLTQPKMLDRVNFGGTWAYMVEDQDRIHKAFQVLDAADLVLMPFSGYVQDSKGCSGTYQTGIQLIDWVGDTLKLQGIAPAVGQARRGFLHDARLFAVSDERVESFDITDRSQPKITDSLKLAQIVTETLDAGTAIVKVGQNWYDNSVSIDTTTLTAVEDPASAGHVDVAIGPVACYSYSWLSQILARNGRVYLMINQEEYGSDYSSSKSSTKLVTIDVADPLAPKVVGSVSLQGAANAYQSAVMVGDTIAALSSEETYQTMANGYQNWTGTKAKLHIIDPRDPNQPQIKSIALPDSYGITELMPSGSTVAVGHYLQSPSNPNRVRYYLDRVDLTQPSQAVLAQAVNIPGTPIAYDATSSMAVTADYQEILLENVTLAQCRDTYRSWNFESPNSDYNDTAIGKCHVAQQTIYLVSISANVATVVGSQKLAMGQLVGNVAVGDDRVFVSLRPSGYGIPVADCMGCGGYGYYTVQTTEMPLLVVGGLNSGAFTFGQVVLSGGDSFNYSPIVASGKRVLLSTGWKGKLMVVDAVDAANPVVVREADLVGSAQSLTAVGGIGIASLYYDGVQTIKINE